MNLVRSLQKRWRLNDDDNSSSSRVQIQIQSDVHLEVGQHVAPLLLLAEDVGRLIDYDAYLGFLQAQVARYRKVFLLLGNHEFYGLDYETGLKEAQRLAAELSIADRLVLLHKTRWDDDESELTILGCTLWSALPEDVHDVVSLAVSDFKQIHDWTPQKHNDMHVEEAAWLREQVKDLASTAKEEGKSRHILVATHHAPCVEGTSRPEHASNPWSPAFATELLKNDKSWKGVKVWTFGHTHYSADFVRGGIRVVANQRGYVFPGQKDRVKKNSQKSKKDALEFDEAKFITL